MVRIGIEGWGGEPGVDYAKPVRLETDVTGLQTQMTLSGSLRSPQTGDHSMVVDVMTGQLCAFPETDDIFGEKAHRLWHQLGEKDERKVSRTKQ